MTPEQFRVTRKNGIERPDTGLLVKNKQAGIHVDIVSASRSSPVPTSMKASRVRSTYISSIHVDK
ncbi:hypothetical protein [Sphingomonas mollis]|uniref:hypothetical protein n=1 Tax=Sphingomonas mollis TaxID=2795726 RepID=UPI003A0FFD71